MDTLQPQTRLGVLNSWKEIAAYLGRGVRTVQRWEEIGLPVRRVRNSNRSPVWAHTRELDAWMDLSQSNDATTEALARNVPVRHSLQESLREARALRKQMAYLREDGRETLLQLFQIVTNIEKQCPPRRSPNRFSSRLQTLS